VFGLNFHHLLIFFLFPLQVYVSTNVCFAKCVLLQLLALQNVTSFVCCQIHFGKFFLFWYNGCCSYLHWDLLDKVALTTITLRVKSPHIEMHEQHLQKGMFMKMENVRIKLKSKRGFEKGDMHVVITIESTTIVSSILAFQLELVPMFFHIDSIRKFRNSI
jgi:hypothetical protein